MRSALFFLLIVSSLAKYEITGKFKVIDSKCDQNDPLQVTDFYKDRVVTFKAENDLSKWPYNDSDADVDVAATTKLDMDRVYVLKKAKEKTNGKTTALLYLNVPQCNTMSAADCPAECETVNNNDEEMCMNKVPCQGTTKADCEKEKDKCEWTEAENEEGSCDEKTIPCTDYKDVYSCVNEGCKWDGKQCAIKSRRNVSRDAANLDEEFVCVWRDDGVTMDCDRVKVVESTKTGSFTMKPEGDDGKDGAGKVLATLAVVVLAVFAVLF